MRAFRTQQDSIDFMTGDPVREAIAETEREIFYDALDEEPPDDDFNDDLEQMDSIDGEGTLSLEEIAEGATDNGYDRPLALHADQELMEENAEQREAFRANVREQLYQQFGILGTDDRVDHLVDALAAQQQQTQNFSNDHVNRAPRSFGGARTSRWRAHLEERGPGGASRGEGPLHAGIRAQP